MASRVRPLIIDDGKLPDAVWAGGRGLIPRNYNTHPLGCYKAESDFGGLDIPLVPKSDWSAWLKEKKETKSNLSDIRLTGDNGQSIPSLNQGQWGYCWAHSSTSCHQALRARDGQPYYKMSAFAVAGTIKNGRNEGGWGAQSMDFIVERGQPVESMWKEGDANPRNGTPAVWENAAKHKVVAGWADMSSAQYDRNLTFDQLASCLLYNIPCVVDFNWWSHSVCALDLVEVEAGSFGILIWNSWGDDWSERGTGILRGSKAIPNGSVAPRVVSGSNTFRYRVADRETQTANAS